MRKSLSNLKKKLKDLTLYAGQRSLGISPRVPKLSMDRRGPLKTSQIRQPWYFNTFIA